MRPVAVAFVLLCAAPAARAEIVAGLLQGTITKGMRDEPRPGVNPYEFTVGESVTLSYSYSTAHVNPDTTSAALGSRVYSEIRPTSFSLTTGWGYKISRGSPSITAPSWARVTDGPTDVLQLSIGDSNGAILLRLSDPTGRALNSLDLPSAAELARFTVASIYFEKEGQYDSVGFEATASPVAVPEASSLAMAGLVVAGLAGYAWRRRRAVA